MIANVRIDDRLIHGQVTQGWIPNLAIDTLVVVSERINKDKNGIAILNFALPQGIKLLVLSPQGLYQQWSHLCDSQDKVMILTDDPDELKIFLETSCHPEKITIGNLHRGQCDTVLGNSVQCCKLDTHLFSSWINHGIELEICAGALDTPEPITLEKCQACTH